MRKDWKQFAITLALVSKGGGAGRRRRTTRHRRALLWGGKGVPQDYSQAAYWLKKAAEQGNAEAQYNLGVLFNLGQGLPQNYAEAYFWFDLAAAKTPIPDEPKQRTDVVKARDAAASKLTPDDLSRVQERAAKWFAEHRAKQ